MFQTPFLSTNMQYYSPTVYIIIANCGLLLVAYGYVWLCMVMYGYVRYICTVMYGYVWLCMVMYGYVRIRLPLNVS